MENETPAVETPAVETPAVETPAVETPAVETPTEPAEASEQSSETPVVEREVPAVEAYKLPKGAPIELAQWAHEQDMTQSQFDASIKKFDEVYGAIQGAQVQKLREAGERHIKEAWGDKADENKALTRDGLKQVDTSGQMTKMLVQTGFINHPVVLDFLFELGKSFKEGGFIKGSTSQPTKPKTAAQAMFGANHPSKS